MQIAADAGSWYEQMNAAQTCLDQLLVQLQQQMLSC